MVCLRHIVRQGHRDVASRHHDYGNNVLNTAENHPLSCGAMRPSLTSPPFEILSLRASDISVGGERSLLTAEHAGTPRKRDVTK